MFLKTQTLKYTKSYLDKVDKIKELIDGADCIIVGAGAGLSASGGINYGDENLFKKWFPKYYDMGASSILHMQSIFWDLTEENVLAYWGYWAQHINYIRYATEATKPYELLHNILKDKEHFIITTNVDGQFEKAGFSSEKIFAPQGEYSLFQCSQPCTDELYHNKSMVDKMLKNMGEDLKIKEEDIPKCPKCGAYLIPNLRVDHRFVEKPHMKNLSNYGEFIKSSKDKKVLLLELGVGYNTPVIIRYPFENISNRYEKAKLVRITMDNATVPKGIEEKSICIDGDIREVLENIK